MLQHLLCKASHLASALLPTATPFSFPLFLTRKPRIPHLVGETVYPCAPTPPPKKKLPSIHAIAYCCEPHPAYRIACVRIVPTIHCFSLTYGDALCLPGVKEHLASATQKLDRALGKLAILTSRSRGGAGKDKDAHDRGSGQRCVERSACMRDPGRG